MLFLQTPTNPSSDGDHAGWQGLLGDGVAAPATAVALAPTTNVSYPLVVGAGVETNTLAAAAFLGQIVTFRVTSLGGGTRAITVATAFNQAGNTILTFNAAGDFCMLVAVALTATTFRWQLVGNDSVALS
jgi:hypothetical protein